MSSRVRYFKSVTVFLVVLLLGAAGWAEDWWPKPAVKELPKEIIDIPSLDDEAFVARIKQLEQEIRDEPTNRDNFEERVDLVRMYYNALQADGVLLPWIGLILTNAMQAQATVPDMMFRQWTALLDQQVVPGLSLLHEHRNDIGRMEVVEPRDHTFEAREYTTIRLVYRVGKMPLRKGSQIRFGQHWYNDLSLLQLSRPLFPGYTTVKASDPDVELMYGFGRWQSVWSVLSTPAPRPLITLKEGELTEGETLTFVLGDQSEGGPGLLMQSYSTDAMTFRFEVDFAGTGAFVPIGLPRFAVHGTKPHHVRVIAPTTVRAGESFTVRANVEDQYFNRAIGCPRELVLSLDAKQVARARPMRSDRATFHFDGLVFPDERTEPLVFEAKDREGRLRGRSNPVQLIGPDDPHVYWGELHGHEGYTDATGTAEWFMRYARDVAFLDFVSLTGHDLMMSEFHQRDVQRATQKYNDPPRFVTFKAYEWTHGERYGGHHNVFYRDDTQRIIPCNEARTIADLYRMQREINDPTKVLIIPHCHMPGDWRFNDAQMERLVEIYSQHGSFEWFGRRYLERGYHVGLMCASDDHTGHPGNNPMRISQRGGLVAVFAPERTREAIFDALISRRVYGTTLARILLDVRVAGAPMGSEVEVARSDPPSLEVRGTVSGTSPIARVVAVCNGEEVAELNYLQPSANEGGEGKAALRVMITNSSEPPDKRHLAPLGRERWWGRIMLGKTKIADATPLGIDGYVDSIAQETDKRVDFVCTTRGDMDGVLLELNSWLPDDTLTVEIYERPYTELESWHVDERMPMWGEQAYYNTKLVDTIKFPLSALDQGRQQQAFGERSAVIAERVGGDLAAHREFTIQVSEGLKQDGENCVYVRAEQIDDEVAWSSPVWVTWR